MGELVFMWTEFIFHYWKRVIALNINVIVIFPLLTVTIYFVCLIITFLFIDIYGLMDDG